MRKRVREIAKVCDLSPLLSGRIPMAALIQTLAVAEYLNFRHAANALGIAQSSISARVKALEDDLGVPLFERHARGVRLTDAGRHFVERVTTGIDQLDNAVRTAGMLAGAELGRLRVGIHALISGSFLATVIERYRTQHPGIDVVVAESTARDSIMQLRANKLDIVFVAGSPELPDLHSRPIWRERLLAAFPASHSLGDVTGVTWADLASNTFIVRQRGTGPQDYDHIIMRLASTSPDLSILRFDVEGGTLLSMVAQGYGVTIAGEALTLLNAPGVTFLPILDEPERLPFSAIWSPHNRSPALRSLLDISYQMRRSSQSA